MAALRTFFENTAVFIELKQNIIPRLFKGKTSEDRLRLWSVGCSTGEEAYSLAMLMVEEAAQHDQSPEIQIFASDLHERALFRPLVILQWSWITGF